jgi:catechol 2,3-dioxygenase-like lactoylglutathione lyase family enzyme
MIGYVTIGAADVEAALPFFDAVFGAMGGERKSFGGGWAFYGDKGGEGDVGITKPQDGQAARAGNGIMIAFKATSQDAVRATHAAALAGGGSDEGAPGFRPPDGKTFYGAYFRDPVGNKFCIFHTP